MVLGGAERWTRPCSACIRVAQRVSENNGGTSFKLLVRGSSPRRPTKGLVGVGVFRSLLCELRACPYFDERNDDVFRGRDGALTVDPVALPGRRPPGRSWVYVGRDPVNENSAPGGPDNSRHASHSRVATRHGRVIKAERDL
jgi:hypothetical protein